MVAHQHQPFIVEVRVRGTSSKAVVLILFLCHFISVPGEINSTLHLYFLGPSENRSCTSYNEGPWACEGENGRRNEQSDMHMSEYSPNVPFHSPTGSCGPVMTAVNTPRIHPPLEPLPVPPVNRPTMDNVMPGCVPRLPFAPSQLIGGPLVCHPPPVFPPRMPVPMMQIPGFPFMSPPAVGLPLGVFPFLAEKASVWSVHVSPDGKNYYYNAMTRISTWDKPEELIEFEKNLNANAALKPAELLPKPVPKPEPEPELVIQRSQEKKSKTCKKENKEGASTAKEKKPRPIASKFVPGSVWCLVKTSDNRIFFYNACKKSSEWEIPPELTHKPELYQMIEEMRKESVQTTDNGQTNDTNSQTSTVPTTNENKYTESSSLDFIEVKHEKSPEKIQTEGEKENPESESLCRQHLKEENGMTKEDSPNTVKKPCADDIQECQECLTTTAKSDDCLNVEIKAEFSSLEEIKSLKGIDIEIVERLAAKERATTPFELRSLKFQELLQDKNVSAFSTWQRELPKIIYDPRYLLLEFKDRKLAFDTYVKARANDEAKENQTRLKNARQEFCKFVESLLGDDEDLSYDKFERKYAKDSRLSLIDKPLDRKRLFMKFSVQHQQKTKREREKQIDDAKSKKKLARKEAKRGFKAFLDKKITSYHYHWKNVWKDFDLWTDRRFLQLDECEMKEMFQKHCQKLKRKSKECKDEKHSKKRKKEKIKDGKGQSGVSSSSPSPQRTGTSSDKNMSEGEISTDSA